MTELTAIEPFVLECDIDPDDWVKVYLTDDGYIQIEFAANNEMFGGVVLCGNQVGKMLVFLEKGLRLDTSEEFHCRIDVDDYILLQACSSDIEMLFGNKNEVDGELISGITMGAPKIDELIECLTDLSNA